MKDMKLKFRILAGYAVPLLLSILVVLVVYLNVRTVETRAAQEAEAVANLNNITEMALGTARMQRSARGYFIAKNAASKERFEEAFQLYLTKNRELQQNVRDPLQRERLAKITALVDSIEKDNRNLIALVDAGRQAEVVARFKDGTIQAATSDLVREVDEFERAEKDIVDARREEAARAMTVLKLTILFGTLLAIALAVFFGLKIAGGISAVIGESANAIAASSTEIAATITQHERTAAQQASMVTETTATVEQLGASSRQTSEQAGATAELAQKATTLTDEGNAKVKEAIDGMAALKEKVTAVADQTLALGEQMGQIGAIANLVKDLAGQTNMLALNAAVEAARAGEHGRGFAVVATEVRKLADQSKKSAEQASQHVMDIQKATNATIMVTEEGTKNVDEVIKVSRELGTLFNGLAGTAGRVYENTQQVLLNSRQQADAIGQIVAAVNSINAGARETAAGVSQTKVGVEKLNGAAQTLKAIA